MAKADVETWAFWAPLVYGLICVLVGFLVHGVFFPLIERGLYAASKRLDPSAWPTLVLFMDEIVAHRLLAAVSRCILVSSFFGGAVLMNLGRDETHFGGARDATTRPLHFPAKKQENIIPTAARSSPADPPDPPRSSLITPIPSPRPDIPPPISGPWIEQLIHSAVVVVCLQLVFRVVDVSFVLVMRNAHRAVSAGTNPTEVRQLYRALSRPSAASSTKPKPTPDPESTDEGRLDDAERGAAPGCFGCCGGPASTRDPDVVALDPETEREFEKRAMWIIKMRAALHEEQVALRKELSAARDAQTERRRAVTGAGGATPVAPSTPATPRGSVPSSPGVGGKGSGTPGVDHKVVDAADAARYERAKRLDKRARELADDQRALDRDIDAAKEKVRAAERERVELERERWREDKRHEKKLRSRDANDPSMLTGGAWGPRAGLERAPAALLYRRALKALFSYLFLGWFLTVWHANMVIFAAFSAVGALFVVFSLRDAAANFLGSLVVILHRPFAVGDWIRTDDPAHEGVVREINFRCTVLVRVDDLTPTEVPNAHFLRAAVSNISRQASFRHEFVLPLSVTVPAEKLRTFVNDARRAVESDGRVNAWVTLHSDPCGAGSNLGGRLVSFRFDFPRGPQSPENLADPEPLRVAGVPCRARRPWLEFLVARDDAVCAALACADAHGLVVGAHAGESIAHAAPPKVSGGGGVARGVPALDRRVPEGGANEGGFDAAAWIPTRGSLPPATVVAEPSSPSAPISPAPASSQMPPPSPKPAPASPSARPAPPRPPSPRRGSDGRSPSPTRRL